jgi:predicted  nucleic acid-binding Zn-ribbon protein
MTLLKAIDTLLDEIDINKINIELYERERQTTKKLENSLSEKKWEETFLQEENWKKRKNIEKLNQHIDLAHQDIENLRNEIEEERQIHEEAMATMGEWYRSVRPSNQESEQKRKELFNEILELGWEINQQSKENKELKQSIKIGKEITEQEISDHQKKNQDLQKEIVDYKKKIINLKKEFENLKGINKLSEIILNEKKSKWKNKKQKFQKEINRLKKLNKNQETDYENYRKEKDNEITNKDNQHHQLNTEKDKKIKCLEDNIDNLEKQIII